MPRATRVRSMIWLEPSQSSIPFAGILSLSASVFFPKASSLSLQFETGIPAILPFLQWTACNTLSRANEFHVSVHNLLLLIDRHFSSVRICFFFLLRREKRLKFSALIMSISCLKITIGCCLVWLCDGLYITNNVGLVNSCADGKWWQFGGINKHLC